jgi:hypothetical protein
MAFPTTVPMSDYMREQLGLCDEDQPRQSNLPAEGLGQDKVKALPAPSPDRRLG